MNTAKENIRNWFRPETRGQFYAAAAGVVTLLASLGFISVSLVPSITGVVLGVLALAYAYVNSDSAKNKVIYSLCAAIGALLIALGVFTDGQNEAILAVVAPVLGIGYAAAKTPDRNEQDTIIVGGEPPVDTWVEHGVE